MTSKRKAISPNPQIFASGVISKWCRKAFDQVLFVIHDKLDFFRLATRLVDDDVVSTLD